MIYFIVINLLYLWDNFAGSLMNLILGGMIISVLLISLIAEKLQSSKINSIYFWSLSGCSFAAILCLIILKFNF